MNYKKLINDHLTNQSDKTPVVIALLSGLAIGAALGLLFAPASGAETRNLIADKSKDLADTAKDKLDTYKEKIKTGADDLSVAAKDKFQTYKDRLQTGADEFADLKDRAVDSVKTKFADARQEVKAAANEGFDNV